jgi:predicted RNase H-like HicB family nuclease
MKFVYPCCFYQEADGRYSVEIPDLNLATFGDDLPDAMFMATDAATGRLLLMLKDGEPLPKARDLKDVVPDDETGFTSMVYVDLGSIEIMRDEKQIEKILTIPSWLNKAAERKNINFSDTLQAALVDKLSS